MSRTPSFIVATLITCSVSPHRFLYAVAIALSINLAACSGGSDSGGFAPPNLNDGSDGLPSNNQESIGLLPDFVTQRFTMAPTYTRGEFTSILLTVANIGDAPDLVPEAWLMVSHTQDFSSGYAIYPFNPFPVSNGDRVLEPGEEQEYRTSLQPPLILNGLQYARIWMNPDRSSNFTNPEDYVIPSFRVAEKNTGNNLSEIRSFEALDFRGECSPDGLEENDTIAMSAPIALDAEYAINACDDQLDVFSIELQAGLVYELKTDADWSSRWLHAIVDSTGFYVEPRRSGAQLLFEPVNAGPHYIVYAHINGNTNAGAAQGAVFSVNSIPQ